MEHIDAMNASLFAQTGAQILVSVVNSTGGADIMDYASDLGNSYGVGSAERNNGVVMLLALDNISQSGLMGDYCVVVGTGLESHADDFMSLQSYYLENDFAAGEYDAGVKATLMPSSPGLPTSTASRSGRGISLPSGRPIPAAAGTTIRRPTAMWRRPLGPGERRCGAASGAAGAVGDPGRNAVLPATAGGICGPVWDGPRCCTTPSSGDGPSGPGHPVLQDRQSHRAGRPPAEHSAGSASAAAGEACSAEAPSGVPEGPGAASAEGPSGAAAAVAAALAEAPSAAAGGDAEALSAAGAGKRQI